MNLYQALQPKTRKKIPLKVWIITLIIVAICIGAFIVWRMIGPKVEYDMIKPIRGDIKSSISASGSLSPVNEVEIGSVISGLVLEVLVDENDEVKVGQVLARINPETINQQIAKFEAQLYSARAQLKASEQTLVDKNGITID